MKIRSCVSVLAAFVCVGVSFADASQRALIDEVAAREGLTLLTVGAPGNRGLLPSEYVYNQFTPWMVPQNMGAVDYTYRMAQTEVRVDQWIRFLNAYAPSHEAQGGQRGDTQFGRGIRHSPAGVQPANYQSFNDGLLSQNMSWYMAARYCNWLHNGAPDAGVATIADFEVGAYDTSTFNTFAAVGPGGQVVSTEQIHRSEGARFWIPSLDEWIKAAHYDPDRYGEGEGGYWQRMAGQDEPLTPGLPSQGGQTNAGDPAIFSGQPQLDWARAGSYPDVQSPWGLLDTSGGEREWVEDKLIAFDVGEGFNTSRVRYALGSTLIDSNWTQSDLIDFLATHSGNSTFPGLRIAAAVPGPGGFALVGAAGLVMLRRRRVALCAC